MFLLKAHNAAQAIVSALRNKKTTNQEFACIELIILLHSTHKVAMNEPCQYIFVKTAILNILRPISIFLFLQILYHDKYNIAI